jgi:radical SAM protein with 4Fe4S-binding SPASM domain
MYYKLHERFALRGWDRLPYAVQDIHTGRTQFLDEQSFRAASFCDGMMDCDSVLLLPVHKKFIAEMKKNGAAVPCEYGDGLKDYQKYRPAPCRFIRQAHWSITGKCNMRCRHCYMSAPEAKYGELSHDTCMDIIKQLSAAGIAQVSLTGGEPLVRSDFLELVDALLAERIIITQIYTNGKRVNQGLLDELKKRGIQAEFSLSFDGVGWHDWMRGVDGADAMTVKAIKLLRDNDFEVSIESAFHAKSLPSLEKTMLLLGELGVRSWKTNPVAESGNWLEQDQEMNIGIDELYQAYLNLIPRFLAAGSPLNMMLGGFFYCKKGSKEYFHPCKKYDGTEKSLRQTMCGSARTTLYIAADGKLLPCIPLSGLPIQDEMPNITEIPLAEALSDSQYLRRIDTRLEDMLEVNKDCAECEHKLVCGGGCRAGALMSGEDYLGRDKYICHFFKNGYEAKVRDIIEKHEMALP